jgi:hypothetical protein
MTSESSDLITLFPLLNVADPRTLRAILREKKLNDINDRDFSLSDYRSKLNLEPIREVNESDESDVIP